MSVGFCLLSIDPRTGTPSTALGPKMGMESTSLSRILKSMEEKGLITRQPNPKDGRGVLIHLTPFGLEKREDSKRVVLKFNETVRNQVSDTELAAFFRVIGIINNLVSERKVYHKSID
jgi:DNA-binding MarR family transcriptional regulator